MSPLAGGLPDSTGIYVVVDCCRGVRAGIGDSNAARLWRKAQAAALGDRAGRADHAIPDLGGVSFPFRFLSMAYRIPHCRGFAGRAAIRRYPVPVYADPFLVLPGYHCTRVLVGHANNQLCCGQKFAHKHERWKYDMEFDRQRGLRHGADIHRSRQETKLSLITFYIHVRLACIFPPANADRKGSRS